MNEISPVDGYRSRGQPRFIFGNGGWLSLYLSGFTIYRKEFQQKYKFLHDVSFAKNCCLDVGRLQGF